MLTGNVGPDAETSAYAADRSAAVAVICSRSGEGPRSCTVAQCLVDGHLLCYGGKPPTPAPVVSLPRAPASEPWAYRPGDRRELSSSERVARDALLRAERLLTRAIRTGLPEGSDGERACVVGMIREAQEALGFGGERG